MRSTVIVQNARMVLNSTSLRRRVWKRLSCLRELVPIVRNVAGSASITYGVAGRGKLIKTLSSRRRGRLRPHARRVCFPGGRRSSVFAAAPARQVDRRYSEIWGGTLAARSASLRARLSPTGKIRVICLIHSFVSRLSLRLPAGFPEVHLALPKLLDSRLEILRGIMGRDDPSN